MGENGSRGFADIVFLIDVSQSMQPCLNSLVTSIGIVLDQMSNIGAGKHYPVLDDWRVKVCGYRDARADGSTWWVETPFTSDASQAKADLGSLEAKGGSDGQQSLLDALWKLAKMPVANRGETAGENVWRYRSRCVFVFTCASCHMTTAIPEAVGAGIDDVAREVINSRLHLSLYCPEADCYHTLCMIDKSEVEFVGSLSDAVRKMEELSRDTRHLEKSLEQFVEDAW